MFTGTYVHGQIVTDTLKNKNVVIQQDSLINYLMQQNIAHNEQIKTTRGFRIQLSSNTNRKAVIDVMITFEQLHPNVKAYFTYQQPYFKLRVGDFQSRMEANRLLQVLIKQFDSAFIVPDDISVSDE
jgi:hypothetical protein